MSFNVARLAGLVSLVCASTATLASQPAIPFPNPGPYTQDYATAWFTEDLTPDTKRFQYAVINLGRAGFQDRWTELGNNQFLHEWRRDTPMIVTYEVPILTAFALQAIDAGTIFQPEGWSYRFIDPLAQPGLWVNTTGDSRFDRPYRVLQWYLDSSQASQEADHLRDRAIAPTNWLTRDSLSTYMADPSANAKFGGTSCGLMLWNEGCAGLGFGFEAVAGKMLGPDQTAWKLLTEGGTDVFELPRVIGDPDLPVGSQGLSFGGGIALVGPTAPVPEPETYALMLSGLALLAWARRRTAGRR